MLVNVLLIFQAFISLIVYSNSYNYEFNVGSNDIYSNTKEFGCTVTGCSISRRWLISGICLNPSLTISILDTDYEAVDEIADIYINDDYIGECQELNQDCDLSMKLCSITNNYDLNSYLDLTTSNSQDYINITIDSSDTVDADGQCENYGAYLYAIYANVTIKCDIIPTTTEEDVKDKNGNDNNSTSGNDTIIIIVVIVAVAVIVISVIVSLALVNIYKHNDCKKCCDKCFALK